MAESDLTGALKSEYIFFGGTRVARRDLAAPTGVYYYFSDRLKTASVITDSSGNIKAESDYYPWGGELQFVNNDTNTYKFTGKERDTESGLDYFGARYYSNGLGRFLTPDWAAKAAAVPYADMDDPQSLNLYSYVRNRPTVMVDADGHLEGNPCTSGCVAVQATATTDTQTVQQKDANGNVVGATITQTTTQNTYLFNSSGSIVGVSQTVQTNVTTVDSSGNAETTEGKPVTSMISDTKAALKLALNDFGQKGLPDVQNAVTKLAPGFLHYLHQDVHDHPWRTAGRVAQVVGYGIALADPPTAPLGVAGLVVAFTGTAADIGNQVLPDKP